MTEAKPQRAVEAVVNKLGGYVSWGKCECPICGGKVSVAEGERVPVVLKCWGRCPDNSAIINWLKARGAWPSQGSSFPVSARVETGRKPTVDWRAVIERCVPDHPRLRRYLDHRGIRESYSDLCFLSSADAARLGIASLRCMVAIISDRLGQPTGVQLTKLATGYPGRVNSAKLTYGKLKGNSVQLCTNEYDGTLTAVSARDLVVAEGVETCASLMELLGIPFGCAVLGCNNLPNFVPPIGSRFNIAVDNDAHGAGLARARELAAKLLGNGTKSVRLWTPPLPHKDWNDYVLAQQ